MTPEVPEAGADGEAPFTRDIGTVPAQWVDANGHMNVLHYLEASERATTAFYEFLGLGATYHAEHRAGLFAVEHHIVYRAELREGDPMQVTCVLCDCDEKRIHFLNRIYRSADSTLAAAIEHVELHVDLGTRRSAPFRAGVAERLRAIRAAHAVWAPPGGVSRVMGLRQGRALP